jgi:Tol biopolymer transport system component
MCARLGASAWLPFATMPAVAWTSKFLCLGAAVVLSFGLIVAELRATSSSTLAAPPGTDVIEPSWAPGGQALAVGLESREQEPLRIAVLHFAGKPARLEVLTGGIPRAFNPAWSPDGRHITYGQANPSTGKGDLYLMDAHGQHQRLLAKAIREPAWSPSGTEIAGWVEDYAALNRLAVVSWKSGAKRLIELPRNYHLRLPFWAPSGRRIGFVANGGVGPSYTIPRSGGKVSLLERRALASASWSHDWKHVAYIPKSGALYVADFPYRNPRRLTHHRSQLIDGDPAWSANDKWIAFIESDVHGLHSSLFVVRSSGGRAREILRAGR